jgi:hypothetical protein
MIGDEVCYNFLGELLLPELFSAHARPEDFPKN